MDNALTVSTYPNTTRYCTQCGQPLPAGARFCPACGTQVNGVPTSGLHAREAEEPVLVIDPPRRWGLVLAVAITAAVVLALIAFYSMRQSSPLPAAPVASAAPAPAPANALPREPKPGTVVMAPEHVASVAAPVAAAPAKTQPAPPKSAAAEPAAAPTPPPRPDKVADNKPTVTRAPAPAKAAEKRAESDKQDVPSPAADGDWHQKLQEELAACETGNIFKASFCKEKARWHYCPHHWGSVPECTAPKRTGNEH